MKKLLSFLLVLATLLCLVPVAATASEEPTAENGSGATYIDLYVKDGLVALFDAYGATAADGDVASWAPVDLYGKAGYDSYLDPSSYTTSLVKGSNLGWKWENGYLSHYWHTDPGGRCRDDDSVFNLNELGALLAGDFDYTVQTVYQYVLPDNEANNARPVFDGNVMTNFPNFGAGNSAAFYMLKSAPVKIGGFEITYLWYYAYLDNWNINRIGIYYETMPDTKNFLYTSEYYTGARPKTLVDENGNTILSPYVQMSPETGVFERSFIRMEATKIRIQDYAPIPRWHGGNYGLTYLDYDITDPSATNMHILGDAAYRAYSTRVYNIALEETQLRQNHLADLCGYYGIDVNGIVALDATDLAALAAEAYEIKIARVANEVADLTDALKAIIAKYVSDAGDEEEPGDEGEGGDDIGGDGILDPNYLDLYVKDGLVALFDAYAAKAEDGAASHWTAVDLHGKTGYNAYLAPSAYTAALSGTWTYCDKGIKMNGNTSLNLDSLGALIGTSYSVQEVIGYPDVAEPSISKNVISSIPASLGTYFTSSLGSFKYGLLRRNQATELTGYSKNFLGIFHEKFGWGASGSYLTHTYYTTDAYNTRVYETLFDADGNDYSGRIVGGPLALERTIFRAHPVAGKAVDGVVPYTTTYKIHTQLPLEYRNETGAKADWSTVISKTAAEADHKSTALRFGHGDATAYSFRVYNKELTVAEINQNHFADLVAYYNIELTQNVLDLPAATLATLGAALSDTTLDAKLGSRAYRETRTAIANTISEAAPSLTDMANSVVSVEGVTYRVSGDYGVRSVFSVNAKAVQGLIDAGYTVTYGAVLALKSENTAKIEVALDKNGKVVLAEGLLGVVTASDQDGFKYLTEDKRGFGAAVTFKADGSDSEYYDDELVFVGFTLLSLDGVTCLTVYDDVSVNGIDALSLVSVHEHALKSTTDKGLKTRLEEILK